MSVLDDLAADARKAKDAYVTARALSKAASAAYRAAQKHEEQMETAWQDANERAYQAMGTMLKDGE
jgi:hypothetical protein